MFILHDILCWMNEFDIKIQTSQTVYARIKVKRSYSALANIKLVMVIILDYTGMTGISLSTLQHNISDIEMSHTACSIILVSQTWLLNFPNSQMSVRIPLQMRNMSNQSGNVEFVYRQYISVFAWLICNQRMIFNKCLYLLRQTECKGNVAWITSPGCAAATLIETPNSYYFIPFQRTLREVSFKV